LDGWLADQLTTTYPDLPLTVAQALVNGGLVLAILDGLDEVPASRRGACREAIDSYAGGSQPYKPFVLTCRAREYAELDADWVEADRQIILVGLQPDQIAEVLEARTSRWPEWGEVRDGIKRGDQRVCELFRSPLRLGIALQAYRGQDPRKLIGLKLEAAKGRLWDALLELGGSGFGNASLPEVRSWLAFLATGMRRDGRQRFWLHELYLFPPEAPRELRRFRICIGLVGGLAVGVAAALLAEFRSRVAVWLTAGVAAGVVIGLIAKAVPTVAVAVGWRTRMNAMKVRLRGRSLVVSLVIGVLAGLLFGQFGARFGLVFGVGIGVAIALSLGLGAVLSVGASTVVTDPPRRLAGRGPKGVLTATRNTGLLFGLVGGLGTGLALGVLGGAFFRLLAMSLSHPVVTYQEAPPGLYAWLPSWLASWLYSLPWYGMSFGLVAVVAVIFGLVFGLPTRLTLGLGLGLAFGLAFSLAGESLPALISGLGFGLSSRLSLGLVVGLASGLPSALVFGLAYALAFGLTGGVDAWLYYHWLCRRLARQGSLPQGLQPFLEWCAEPERGWLRLSDACEFRHRELLDHLASDTETKERG
jgi:hypothetical protein